MKLIGGRLGSIPTYDHLYQNSTEIKEPSATYVTTSVPDWDCTKRPSVKAEPPTRDSPVIIITGARKAFARESRKS